MIDWELASPVAFTGIVSVFIALGILSITVYVSGLYFTGRQRAENEEHEANTS